MAEDFKIVVGTEVVPDKKQAEEAISKLSDKIALKVGLSVGDTSAVELEKQLQKEVEKTAKTRKTSLKSLESQNRKFATQQTKTLNSIESKALRQSNPLTGERVAQFKRQLNRIKDSIAEIDVETSNSAKEAIRLEVGKLNDLVKELKSAQNKSQEGIKSASKLNAKIGQLEALEAKKLGGKTDPIGEFDSLHQQITNLKNKYIELKKELSSGEIGTDRFAEITKEVEGLNNAFNLVKNSAQEALKEINIEKYKTRIQKTLDSLESKAFKQGNKIEGESKAALEGSFSEIKELMDGINESSFENIKNSIDLKLNNLKNAVAEFKAVQANLNKGPNKITSEIDTKVGKLSAAGSYEAILGASEGTGLAKLRTQITEVRSSYESLKKSLANVDIDSADYEQIVASLREVDNIYKQVIKSAEKYATAESTALTQAEAASQIAQAQAKLKSIGENYSALKTNPQLLAEFERLVNASYKLDAESVKEFSKEVSLLGKNIQIAGLDKKDFIGSVTEKVKKFTSWFDVSQVVMSVYRAISTAANELKVLDSTLTEVSKTSDRTATSLENLKSASFASASEFGVKANDYLTAIQEFSRAGFGTGTDEGLARLSLQAQAAGDMTATLAQDYLLATNAAYKLEGNMTQLTTVLDGMNMVTNRNATSMEDLAEGVKVVASQAAGAKVQVDELSAAIGTIDAVTRQGGNVAGRGFRTVLMNLQGADAIGQITDDGEEITIESANKVGKALESVGVAAREFKNGVEVLRDPMEILKELATVFNSLDASDSRRADLLSALGGKYRANTVEALLSNWDMYEKMLKDYSEGTGSSYAEAMKSANNLEGSLNRLSNTWTSVVNNFADSNFLKFIVNLGNGFLGAVDSVTRFTDSLGSLANPSMLAALYAAFGNKGRPNMVMPCYAFDYGSRAA